MSKWGDERKLEDVDRYRSEVEAAKIRGRWVGGALGAGVGALTRNSKLSKKISSNGMVKGVIEDLGGIAKVLTSRTGSAGTGAAVGSIIGNHAAGGMTAYDYQKQMGGEKGAMGRTLKTGVYSVGGLNAASDALKAATLAREAEAANMLLEKKADYAYLNATKGAFGAGHSAIAVGNDNDGWKYMSRDANHTNTQAAKTIKDLLDSEDEIAATKIGNRYNRRAIVKTTPAQDLEILKRYQERTGKKYSFTKENCNTAASYALTGKIPKKLSETIPNLQYKNLVRQGAVEI